jgi:predicted aspartyl protease
MILPFNATFAADGDPKIEVPAEGASVQMLDIGGRPVVEVKINGKGPFPFILDTGAMFTVIDSSLSDELSLGESAPIKEFIIGAIKITDP